MIISVLNGPNLGRLGTRQPEIYGHASYQDLVNLCEETAAALDCRAQVRQTESEAELLGWLHEAADRGTPVVLNPAGWTHTSVALRDACAALTAPLVEVHISNIHAREDFRRMSYVSPVASAVIAGCGITGYALAIQWLHQQR
ncbi:MAG: type II 3-dehydroquinate dehydratase [Angustibacter sp.]